MFYEVTLQFHVIFKIQLTFCSADQSDDEQGECDRNRSYATRKSSTVELGNKELFGCPKIVP